MKRPRRRPIATARGGTAPSSPATQGHLENVSSKLLTGVRGNYLRSSIVAARLDPENLSQSDKSELKTGSGDNTAKKAWHDIWGTGKGTAQIACVPTLRLLVDRLAVENREAKRALAAGVHAAVVHTMISA